MRSEAEMLSLILGYARQDERVRAVILNGSRVNPNAPRDPFQDYDVVYLVREVEPFIRNADLVRYFGELMILQLPEDMGRTAPLGRGDPPPEGDGHYCYLMQFLDGTRIDLSFFPLERAAEHVTDSLSQVLLDKDGLFGALPPPTDRDYLPKPPTARAFGDCCNEFWWVAPYAAKGLWRGELTYAHAMLDEYVREQLMKMLVWYFGIRTGFQKAPGKLGKYLQGGLEPEVWARLERTYADADPEHTWQALYAMGELFRDLGRAVGAYFGFAYPEQDDRNVWHYIRDIHDLPRDAGEIYPDE